MPGGSRHTSARHDKAGRPSPRTPLDKAGGPSPRTPPERAGGSSARNPVAGPGEGRADESRIADAIRPVVTAAGMDLESVRVTAAGRRRLLRVVVDSDRGVSLDDAATVSRELSAVLDAGEVMGDFPYTLEVSSPGVDRPLVEPRHWRRAAGRLVKVKVADGGATVGRVVSADAEEVVLDVDGVRRRFAYIKLGPGAIQVEFGHLPEEPAQQPEARDGH
ncbi:MAG: ribosome maturation factor RimP [Streptosporangiaceae bacterium]|nr:ribosome maturation factor RimP [Streptosporangiaceae bacterium]